MGELEDLRRLLEEKTKYNSELNKFVANFCNRKMTVTDIDAVQYKMYYNEKTDKIRMLESKHSHEKYGSNQEKILSIFSKLFKETKIIKGEVYTVFGNYPYLTAKVYSFETNETKEIDQKQLIRFLDFNVEFEDLEIFKREGWNITL